MELICSICSCDLDIVTRWPRLIPNTGDTICQCCAQQIVEMTIDHTKIKHLQNDLQQLLIIKQNDLKLDDFPLNQSLLRILQSQKHKSLKNTPHNFESKLLHNQTFEDLSSEETSIDSNFLDDLATSVKKPNKITLKRYKDQDDSFVSLNYSSYSSNSCNKICTAHRRQLEVVCLQCQQMICTNCALFGQHKGHYIYSEEDIISLLEMKTQELTDLIEKVVKDSDTINQSQYQLKINAQIKENQQKLVDRVNSEFNSLRKILDNKEQQVIMQITLIFDQIAENWNSWWNANVAIENNCKTWIQQAQGTFDKFTEQSQQTKYWDLLNQTEVMKNQGQHLQQEIRKMQQQIKNKTEQLFQDEISLKFYPQFIRIEEFCRFQEKDQQNMLLTSFQCQQHSVEETDLLNDVSATFMNEQPLPSFKANDQFLKTQQDLIPKTAPRGFRSATPKENIKLPENQEPSLSPIMKGMQLQESTRMSTTRKKSQVPLKLQLYMDELKKGKYEAAEFNQLDLCGNDQLLQTVCGELRHWKIKQLKMMKSRLNDDQLVMLLRGIMNNIVGLQCNDNVQSVNLSQNNLSDKSIEYIFQLYTTGMINPQLKNVIVSQNKINARNMKSRLLDLKKLGLTITL